MRYRNIFIIILYTRLHTQVELWEQTVYIYMMTGNN